METTKSLQSVYKRTSDYLNFSEIFTELSWELSPEHSYVSHFTEPLAAVNWGNFVRGRAGGDKKFPRCPLLLVLHNI